MKKLLILLLAAVLLAGCAEPVATVTPTGETTVAYFQRHIVWAAQYVRTDLYTADAAYPQVFVFDSVEALRSYGEYDRLQEYCGGYNEDFFRDRFLVAVLVEEPSGSNSHEVTKIEQTDGKTVICIDRIQIHSILKTWHTRDEEFLAVRAPERYAEILVLRRVEISPRNF